MFDILNNDNIFINQKINDLLKTFPVLICNPSHRPSVKNSNFALVFNKEGFEAPLVF